jgi:predicted  nucleic acid-binding Zn-ribbon protein
MTETNDDAVRIQARLDEWSARLEKLEMALGEAQAQGRTGYEDLLALINTLRREQSEMRDAIDAIRHTPEHDRPPLKSDANLRMDQMQKSFDRAMSLLPPG